MTNLDLREAFNAVSEVVVNRPEALREFDQIYMKISDMLLHAELVSRCVDGKDMVFLGDGDAIGLTLTYLKARGVFNRGPAHVHILDFDERIVNSVLRFAERFELERLISAELYNVADPLPEQHRSSFEAFHINPPFGASNEGKSVEAFLRRGDEAIGKDGVGCIVIADDPSLGWTRTVSRQVQRFLLDNGLMITELVPRFQHYHLDDKPDLTSCSIIAARHGCDGIKSSSYPLPEDDLKNFYGQHAPLSVHYIRDDRAGGKFASKDYRCEPLTLGG